MAHYKQIASRKTDVEARIEAIGDRIALTTGELASALGVSKTWLEIQRSKGIDACPWLRLGPGIIRYRKADVLAWLETLIHTSTSEYAPHQKGNLYGRRGKPRTEGR